MAVGAHRRLLRPRGNGSSVDTLLVRKKRLRAMSAGFHYELLPVAGAAGGGNVRMVDSRFRVCGGEEFMGAAVTIRANRCLAVACLDRCCMKTEFVGGLLVRIARCTRNLRPRVLVRSC